MLRTMKLMLACFAVLVATAGQVQAATILVEPPGSHATNFWPANTSGQTWQMVYDDSFFGSSPLTINSFAFRGLGNATGPVSWSNFVVNMSTTTVEAGSMSTTFASNVGGDNALVKSGPLTISAANGVFTVFMLDTPFSYSPSAGSNLLLSITHGFATSGSAVKFDSYSPTVSGLERVATAFGPNAASGTSFGFGELVTQFDVSASSPPAVPEPSSLILFGIGALGLFGYGLRKKRKNMVE